ncbi:MAG: hypothetical protein PHX62_09305 [Bacilli bacterium]|nr:hypothetical protein [Bacilli bacterium]
MGKNDVSIDIDQVVSLAANERVLKTFEGFEIVEPTGKGYFTVTNYRLIYYATFRDNITNSITVRECPIENVGEISSEFGKRTKRLQKTLGLVALLLGVGGLIFGGITFLYQNLKKFQTPALVAGGILALLGLIIVLTSKRKMFTLELFTRTPRSSIVSLTSDFFQSPSRGRIKIRPNSDTNQMIKDLGKWLIEAKNLK